MARNDLFVGWAAPSKATRRGFIAGAAVTIGGLGALAGALALNHRAPGDGAWNQNDVHDYQGWLVRAPYPALRTRDAAGAPRTIFLATSGKNAVALPVGLAGAVRVRGSLIARDAHAMLATDAKADWIAPARFDADGLTHWPEEDLGEVLRAGEILDAKCWFGAMRPGFGKTHKSCAALCARGGLPLAFCEIGSCGDAVEAPLFLNEAGRPHGRAILPYVADPILARGRLVRVGDVMQMRVNAEALRRL